MKWIMLIGVCMLSACSAVSIVDNKDSGCLVSIDKPMNVDYSSQACTVKVVQLANAEPTK